jgi:hypothetical protein
MTPAKKSSSVRKKAPSSKRNSGTGEIENAGMPPASDALDNMMDEFALIRLNALTKEELNEQYMMKISELRRKMLST